jgi:dynein heavy chain
VTSEDGKGKVDDYWKPSQKLLGDANFMQKLLEYDKDNITVTIVGKVCMYL